MLRRRTVVSVCLLTLLFSSAADSQGEAAAVASAIAAVASTIKSISEFFATNKNETRDYLDHIDARLAQIQTQLNTIEGKIDLIAAGLADLKLYIGDKFDEEQRIKVLAEVKLVNQHFKTWKLGNLQQHPETPPPSLVLNDLQTARTNLMERKSYANYSTVAIAMVYERVIASVMHVNQSADLQSGFESYTEYFRNAADPSGTGETVAKRLVAYTAERDAQIHNLNARRPLYCSLGADKCTRGSANYAIENIQILAGDLTSGFTDSGRTYRTTKGLGPTVVHGGGRSGGESTTVIYHGCPNPPEISATAPADSCIPFLNSLISTYNTDLSAMALLAQAIADVNSLSIVSKAWADSYKPVRSHASN